MDIRKRISFLLLISLTVVLMAGCTLSLNRSQGLDTIQTQGSVLFQDDFSSSTGGWSTTNSLGLKVGYADGGLKFSIQDPNEDAWSLPGFSFTDSRIEVSATKENGSDNDDFGILCRYQDADNFYSFLISSDGYFGINKRANGTNQLLGNKQMKFDPAILLGNQANQIRADCIRSTLTLYVNGSKLIEVNDATYNSGEAGLIAGTFDAGGVEIRFDHFRVMAP